MQKRRTTAPPTKETKKGGNEGRKKQRNQKKRGNEATKQRMPPNATTWPLFLLANILFAATITSRALTGGLELAACSLAPPRALRPRSRGTDTSSRNTFLTCGRMFPLLFLLWNRLQKAGSNSLGWKGQSCQTHQQNLFQTNSFWTIPTAWLLSAVLQHTNITALRRSMFFPMKLLRFGTAWDKP